MLKTHAQDICSIQDMLKTRHAQDKTCLRQDMLKTRHAQDKTCSRHMLKTRHAQDQTCSRYIFSCVSSYYKGKYILCVIYRRVVSANISQFQQKCLQLRKQLLQFFIRSFDNFFFLSDDVCYNRRFTLNDLPQNNSHEKKLTWSPLYLTLFTKMVFLTKLSVS